MLEQWFYRFLERKYDLLVNEYFRLRFRFVNRSNTAHSIFDRFSNYFYCQIFQEILYAIHAKYSRREAPLFVTTNQPHDSPI